MKIYVKFNDYLSLFKYLEDVIRVEWTKSQHFCGTFLEDLLDEICQGQ